MKNGLFIFLISIPVNLLSQVDVFISAGLNYGDVFIAELNDRDKRENKAMRSDLNFNLGISADYTINNKLKLSTGLFYSRRGVKLSEESFYAPFLNYDALAFYYWEIPAIVRFPIKSKKIEIGGGIINSIIIGSDVIIGINFYNPYQLDIKGLLRWNINSKLNAEIGYLYGGLNHIYNSENQFYFGHSIWSLNINCRFIKWNFSNQKK